LDTFQKIEAFPLANPSEIVTIIQEDYINAPNGLTNMFNAIFYLATISLGSIIS
jgi:hypothetical protein